MQHYDYISGGHDGMVDSNGIYDFICNGLKIKSCLWTLYTLMCVTPVMLTFGLRRMLFLIFISLHQHLAAGTAWHCVYPPIISKADCARPRWDRAPLHLATAVWFAATAWLCQAHKTYLPLSVAYWTLIPSRLSSREGFPQARPDLPWKQRRHSTWPNVNGRQESVHARTHAGRYLPTHVHFMTQ